LTNLETGEWGTAFPIDCRKVEGGYRVTFLTAGHCLWGLSKSQIGDSSGLHVRDSGTDLRTHGTHDAGTISFVFPSPIPTVPLRFTDLTLGEEVWVSGYGGDPILWITEGLASAPNRITAPIWPGNSGSPVLDRDGRAVGIVIEIHVGSGVIGAPVFIPHQAVIVPLSLIRDWLGS
jgi:hypothetical protein